MNHVYVLPQLHTLLWSNKKAFKIIKLRLIECFVMIKFMLIDIMLK